MKRMKVVERVVIGILLVFACSACAVPPELALIMGEWTEESGYDEVHFVLDECGSLVMHCEYDNDSFIPYDDVLFGEWRDEKTYSIPERYTSYVGLLTDDVTTHDPMYDADEYKYYVSVFECPIDPLGTGIVSWMEEYYFNLVSINEIEGMVMVMYEIDLILGDGMVILGDWARPFTAYRK